MYSTDDDFLNRIEGEPADEQWRQEVASRLDRYRGRRKKSAAAQNSLSFDFEQAESSPAPQSPVARAVADKFQSSDVTCDTNYYRRLNAGAVSDTVPPVGRAPLPPDNWLVETDSDSTPPVGGELGEAASMAIYGTSAVPDYDPDFDFDRPREFAAEISREQDAPSGGRQAGNLIHFPRPSIRLPIEPPTVEPRPREELAEPISNPPRILDVPEEIVPTIRGPLFAEIRLDVDKPQAEAVDAPSTASIELPLQVASFSQRTFAGLVDGLIVLVASAIFCAAVWKTVPELPHGKAALALLLIPVFFWTVYHYLLLVYAGKTAGMEMASLCLRSFDGCVPTWKQRKHRVYSMLFSLVSIGLGFAWALVDEDCLCWHDRMTSTFLTPGRGQR
jgi:uncharacterized RDD family membrane protein YckC